MFFPERIKNIKSADKVLEVGPGSLPFIRANTFLERNFSSEESVAQRGFAEKINLSAKTVFYDGGRFPFADNEFDYVICSHVLEHVPMEELDLFISELKRVAKKGYLEFPNIFYELINYQPVHLWLMNFRDGRIYFFDKKGFETNFIHQVYREMVYANNLISEQLFSNYKELFFYGFEWEDDIHYKIVDDLDAIINKEDYLFYKTYLNNIQTNRSNITDMKKKISNLAKKIMGENIFSKIKLLKNSFFDRGVLRLIPAVKKTAIIRDRRLVKIAATAEIGDYVIINAFNNPVEIGEHSQINPFTVIYGHDSVHIGKNVMVAPHCMISSGNHDFKQLEVPMRFAGTLSKGPIVIEDNVWIGANCTITDGVKIGHDAVVGANSLVNKDVAPYDIVGGVPAKTLGNRLKQS